MEGKHENNTAPRRTALLIAAFFGMMALAGSTTERLAGGTDDTGETEKEST
jgi:hypothetical protein